MGKYKDISGQKFGRLTALEIDVEKTKTHSSTYWKCQCDCGNIKSISLNRLRNGSTKSCGCYRKEVASNNTKKDLVGQKFGRLTVIKDSGKRKDNRIIWECQCECGNIVYYATNDLTTGNTQSCGCLHKEMVANLTKKDLIGQRFGKLTVLFEQPERKNNRIIWHCRCDCGNECDTSSKSLLSGRKISCGCLKTSLGEYRISNILSENNITYIKEYKYKNLGNLRYDFYLPDYNRLIEFDGEQHFMEVPTWGELEATQKRDKIKNDYALSHNISLVRIPYWERDNITLDLLLGNKYLQKE